MKTTPHFLSALLVATLALGQAEKPSERDRSSGTVRGEIILEVTLDPKVPRPDLGHFINSQPALPELSRKILNLDEPPTVFASQTERGSTSLRIVADRPTDPKMRPAVREFAEAILAALPGQLAQHQKQFIADELERARRRVSMADVHAEGTRESVKRHRAELRALTGRIDAVENWSDAITAMEQERHRLTIDLAGQQARRRAIEETIAKVTKQAEARAKDDPIVAELSKILDIRERELGYARALKKTNDVSDSAVADVEMKVADARAKLLERRELATRLSGGELLTDLNRELLMLSITGAEHEARLKAIRESLERFHEASGEVEALRRAEKELLAWETRGEEARRTLSATEERYDNVSPPTVSVVDVSYSSQELRRQ